MFIGLVGSNPSCKNTDNSVPFEGTRSGDILNKWISQLNINNYRILNVAEIVTSNNRPLKVKEYEFNQLEQAVKECDGVIALGNTAADALNKIGNVPYFKLPHPSPRNRILNDPYYLRNRIAECRNWLGALKRKL